MALSSIRFSGTLSSTTQTKKLDKGREREGGFFLNLLCIEFDPPPPLLRVCVCEKEFHSPSMNDAQRNWWDFFVCKDYKVGGASKVKGYNNQSGKKSLNETVGNTFVYCLKV